MSEINNYMNYANTIIERLHTIGGLNINSISKIPLQVNNNLLLNDFEDRILIIDAIINIIEEKDISFDAIVGAKSRGIAHAAGVSSKLKVPLLLVDEPLMNDNVIEYINGIPGLIKNKYTDEDIREIYEFRVSESFNLVAAIYPYGIPLGIAYANRHDTSFCYIREIKLEKGNKYVIEGKVAKGQNALLIERYVDNFQYNKVSQELKNKGINTSVAFVKLLESDSLTNASGKKLLVIDDMILAGKSTAQEIDLYRDKGAYITDVITLFDYGFDDAKKIFNSELEYKRNRKLYENCNIHTVIHRDIVIDFLRKYDLIKPADNRALDSWIKDKFLWENTH